MATETTTEDGNEKLRQSSVMGVAAGVRCDGKAK
jgi:hypothetical protein